VTNAAAYFVTVTVTNKKSFYGTAAVRHRQGQGRCGQLQHQNLSLWIGCSGTCLDAKLQRFLLKIIFVLKVMVTS
jgi:hypothetical protein